MKIAKLLGALSLILGTQTLAAQSVTYDFDKAIDFSKYKTYAWVDAGNIPDDFNHKRIVGAVDAQLGAHALTQVAQTGNPDILVSYRAGFEQGLEVNANSTDFGPYRWGNRTGSARVHDVTVGTLFVLLRDANTQSVVWRAAATADIDKTASPEKRDRNIRKAAEKMFKHYPPKA